MAKTNVNAVGSAAVFAENSIIKILLKIAPPVMLTQLIQAMYNIVDSFFVGMYSGHALTALSVVYPIQFIIIALAVGTGVGVNTYMAGMYGRNRANKADAAAGTGMVLEIAMWAIFSIFVIIVLKPYVAMSAASQESADCAVTYGMIVCIGSLGSFLESNWTKVHQAQGNMKTPMIAQVTGSIVNVIFDPILIFGFGPIPALGVAGAAYATVMGQFTAAAIVGIKGYRRPPAVRDIVHYAKAVYRYGWPSIIMQLLMTLYIVVLNIILAGFSDAAVTVLGLYYKMQAFFFIPLFSLQTCIVPVISYNYVRNDYDKIKRIIRDTVIISVTFMLVGAACFEFIPHLLIMIFSRDAEVIELGVTAFRIIGLSFVSAVFSLLAPVFFQAIGKGAQSMILSLTRQIFCLIPIFWALSLIGVNYVWFAFPAAETITGIVGIILYIRQIHSWDKKINI